MTQQFYDDLASDYHLIFADWDASVARQADVLVRILGSAGVKPPARVLDCACGIGTQTIGLARAGFTMTGTDLSPDAVARARVEAERAATTIEWAVADMRAVDGIAGSGYAAGICCDNSLPHLLLDDDLDRALAAIRRCLAPGALFVASTRDYDELAERRPSGTEPQLFRSADGKRRVVGQAWEWSGDIIDVALFIVVEGDGGWSTTVREMQYRAWRRAEVDAALERAGFIGATWATPAVTGYYQPIVTARAE
jgi:SAM-dependent methyltransferase